MEHQNTQYTEQLEDMIERTSDLETRNDSYADRVERLESELARQFRDLSDQVSTLEASSDARRKVFEVETRRIWEHAERIFYARIETNTRQIEALNLAMQFQRAEIRRMRQAFRELQHAIASQLSLSVDPSLHAGHSDSGAAICGAPSAEPADQTEDLTALPHAPHSEAAPSPIEPDVAEQSLESVARGDAGAAEAEGGSESLSQASQRETPEWLSDYSAKVDRNSGWKSHVERLFHEARTVDAMTDEDIAARGANATARAGAAENPALAPSTDLIGAGENHVPASVGDATA